MTDAKRMTRITHTDSLNDDEDDADTQGEKESNEEREGERERLKMRLKMVPASKTSRLTTEQRQKRLP